MQRTKKMKRRLMIASALLFLFITVLSALPVSAASTEPPETVNCEALVLYDKTHEKYVIEKNGYAILNTSTSAKITMGLVACETLADRLDETVTITDDMLKGASGYSMKLKVGEKIKIRDLLYGAICGSYNDAAYVIANICGGSSQGFVEMMNAKALELGAKDTTYTNPLGYPDNDAMTTTAYNVLRIALAASENQLYMEICSAIKHTVASTNLSSERNFYNRNYLVSSASNPKYHNANCLGMNAGYSGEAGGWSIVTLIRDSDKAGGDVDYICVLLHGKESEDGSEIFAYDDVNLVAKWACKTYDNKVIFTKGAQLGTTKIGLTTVSDAPYLVADDLVVYVPAGVGTVSYHTEFNDDIRAPLKAGDVIGKVIATVDGEKVGECDLILKEDYEINGVIKVIDIIGSYTKSRAFIATIIAFVLIMAAVMIYKYNHRYDSHGKYTRKK